jgi:hypothetical protein
MRRHIEASYHKNVASTDSDFTYRVAAAAAAAAAASSMDRISFLHSDMSHPLTRMLILQLMK